MKKLKKSTVNNIISFGIVIIAFIICQSMIASGAMKRSLKGQMVPICVYIVMAVSLNLVVGISGELSLGHAGFMSVGAFSGIIASAWLNAALHVDSEVLRLVLAMIVGGMFAGIAGVLIGIPVLRLRGDYLAIVTLAFGEIIRNVLNCLYFSLEEGRLHVSFNNPNIPGTLLVSGPQGATGVDKIATFPMGFASATAFLQTSSACMVPSRSSLPTTVLSTSRQSATDLAITPTHSPEQATGTVPKRETMP